MPRGRDDGKQRALGPPHGNRHEAGDSRDQADDRKRERILRAEQCPKPDGVAVADDVLNVLLDHETESHDGKEPKPGCAEA